MRIQSRDRRDDGTERISLVPESLDDLWHLQYVLGVGDRVEGDTTRRIQRDDDRLRDTGGEREHMHVTLEVESVEFHKFANRLRVSGVIVECSREDQLGHHHTLNVEQRKEITVIKRLKSDQEERLQEAVEASEVPDVAIATVEEGRAHVHTVAQYGVDEYASITAPTGKGEYAQSRTKLFSELTDSLRRLDVDAIVLAGPGFTKDDAHGYLQENAPELAERVSVVDTSAVGDRGVHEVLKRGAVDAIQQETRIAREAEYIDELTEQIAGEGKAAYGPEEVRRAADYGAVERLLVLDEWLRRARANAAGSSGESESDDDGSEVDIDVDDVIRTVERQGGEVTVFSSEFAPGQQLRNLGGIAALLRYRID
jgi:protein pelota